MKLLVISGGRHPYDESTPVLEMLLKDAGHDVTVTEDPSVLAKAADMNGYDALVFNTRRENIPDFGDLALSDSEQSGMKDFIRSGKGFVCLHISTCLPAGGETAADFADSTSLAGDCSVRTEDSGPNEGDASGSSDGVTLSMRAAVGGELGLASRRG